MNKLSVQKSSHNNQHGFAFLGIIVLVLLVLAILLGIYLSKQQNIFRSKAHQPQPIFAPNNNITLVADKGEYKVGENINLSVYVKNQLESANLYVAKLNYSNNLIIGQSIEHAPGTNFITTWTESIMDQNKGTVDLIGEVKSPGFKTTTSELGTILANINFKANLVGVATFGFNTTSIEPTAIYSYLTNLNILTQTTGTKVDIISIATPIPTSTPAPSPTRSPTPTCTKASADINKDNRVNLPDLSGLLTRFLNTGPDALKADLNGDCVVNSFDYGILLQELVKSGSLRQ